MEKAITKVIPGMSVVPLGTRPEVKEIAVRIQKMAPGGMKYTLDECLTIAQYSIALGANPLAGEVYLMKNQRSGEVIGLTPGIKLFRRKADEQDERSGDSRWIECTPLAADEYELFGIDKSAMAYKARLYNRLTVQKYAETAKMLSESGAKWENITNVLGERPCVEGIGVLTAEEIEQLDRNSRNKMPHVERCKKRAEAAAIKVKYHLDYGFVPIKEGSEVEYGNALADDYIDVKVRHVTDMMDESTGDTAPGEVTKKPSAMFPDDLGGGALGGKNTTHAGVSGELLYQDGDIVPESQRTAYQKYQATHNQAAPESVRALKAWWELTKDAK